MKIFANFIEEFVKADLEILKKKLATTVMMINLDKFSSTHRREDKKGRRREEENN